MTNMAAAASGPGTYLPDGGPELRRANRRAGAGAEAGEAAERAPERRLAPGSGRPGLGFGSHDCGEGLAAAGLWGRSGPDGGPARLKRQI